MTLVASMPLTYLHVFAYSDRPGTRASSLPVKVNPETIAFRSERLRELGERKNDAFQRRFTGKDLRALVLRQRSRGRPVGRPDRQLHRGAARLGRRP